MADCDAVSSVSAALGYMLLGPASGLTGAFAQGFAAGACALMAMVVEHRPPRIRCRARSDRSRWSASGSRSPAGRPRVELGLRCWRNVAG